MGDRELERDQHRRAQRRELERRLFSRHQRHEARQSDCRRFRDGLKPAESLVLAPDAERRVTPELESDCPVPQRRDAAVRKHGPEHDDRDRGKRKREERDLA